MSKIVAVGYDSNTLLESHKVFGDIEFISVEDIPNYKADILIISIDCLSDLFNAINDCYQFSEDKVDLYEYDRLNRYKYKNYKKVYLVSIECFFGEFNYHFKSLYTNLIFIDDFIPIDTNINDDECKVSNIKMGNILKLKEYVDKQNDYFDSKEIMKKFNVSNRWIKRYMYDMNKIYNNIGYSYSKRKWYKISEE